MRKIVLTIIAAFTLAACGDQYDVHFESDDKECAVIDEDSVGKHELLGRYCKDDGNG